MRSVWLVVAISATSAACGDNHVGLDAATIGDAPRAVDATVDVPTDADPLRPATLFGTGLCVDEACTQISPDVHEYEPRWPLWADAASKRRWIYLPPGTTIDTTTDPDYWRFPVGTKMWKEFTQGTDKVETRYIVNTGVGVQPWFYMPYQWNVAGTETTAVPDGVFGANGTIHDIPSQHECATCHENTTSKVLGFGALQLDFTPPDSGMLDLDGVNTLGWLDTPSPSPAAAGDPHYPMPASTTGGTELPALGYVHANCSHCHNPHSTIHDITTIEMRLLIGDLTAYTNTAIYRTMVGATDQVSAINGDTLIIDAGDPTHSVMIDRMLATNGNHMPALGSNVIDTTGVSAIETWISSIH